MNKFMLFFSVFLASNVYAISETEASRIVRIYSELVSCYAGSDYIEHQYKAIEIVKGSSYIDTTNQTYLVYWTGDIGCSGGNNSVTSNFTVVQQRGSISVPPIVIPGYNFPYLDIIELTDFSIKKDIIKVQGTTYGEGSLIKKVTYEIKFIDDEFIIQ